MALYAISDLHLAQSINKPMDVFGSNWEDYMTKIKCNWQEIVKDDDYIIMPGDLSWATYLEQSYKDFEYLNELPGIKIISKGNHDYWWTTVNKLNKFIQQNQFEKIIFLHNNYVMYKQTAICGTRGWDCPVSGIISAEDEKIYNRELQRLELSIKSCLMNNPHEIIAALHYPPVNRYKDMNSGFIEILKKYQVKKCIYGHLHADSQKNALVGRYEDIDFYLVASDYVDFSPVKLLD